MGRFGNICALLRNWIINILVSHNKDPAYILIAKFGSLLNTSNYVQIALISIDFPYFHIWWGFHGISRISMFGSLLNIWTRCVGWHPHVFFFWQGATSVLARSLPGSRKSWLCWSSFPRWLTVVGYRPVDICGWEKTMIWGLSMVVCIYIYIYTIIMYQYPNIS